MIDAEALRHCEDFLVDSPGGRVGFVAGVRYAGGDASSPHNLVVRAGRAGGRLFIIPISQLATIIVNRRRIVLRALTITATEPAPEAPVPAPVHGVPGREPVASHTGVASTLEFGTHRTSGRRAPHRHGGGRR